MEVEFWHQRWARNEIGFHQKEVNAHLQTFWSGEPQGAGDTVFVPLCGKSLDMLWLRSRGYRVLGVEISPLAVENFFRENDLTPEKRERGDFVEWEVDGLVILQGDFFNLTRDDLAGVSTVYDRASLVALPQEMRRDYADRLERILPAGADLLLVTLEYPQSQMQGPPFSVEEAEVRQLYAGRYDLRCCFELDVLAENPRFRERGLSRMVEKVFNMRDRSRL